MKIQIELTPEQENALKLVVDDRNSRSGTDISQEEHLTEILQAEILRYTDAAYENSGRKFIEGFRTLPYETRQAIITDLEQQLPK